MKNYLIVLLAILGVFSCDNSETVGKYVIHPTGENFIKADSLSFIIGNNEIGYLEKNKREVLELIEQKEKLFQIGRLDSVKEEIFSSIDQVIINDKKIYILDEYNVRISVFSVEGDYIRSIGSKGQGPDEFNQPTSIEVFNENIFISDRLYSVKRANIKNDSIIQLGLEFKTPLEAICTSDSVLVVKATSINETESNLFSTYSLNDLSKINSFGATYSANDVIIEEMLSEGIISCKKEDRGFLYANYTLPYIYSYSLDGKLDWVSKIQDYNPLKFREEKGKGMTMRWNNDRIIYDEYISIFEIGKNALVQTEKFENIISKGTVSVESMGVSTYLIEIQSGIGIKLSEDIPKILYLDNDYLVIKSDTDYPKIDIYEI